MAVSIGKRTREAVGADSGDAGGCSALVYSGAKPWGNRGVSVPAGASVQAAMALDPIQFSDLELRPISTFGADFQAIDVPGARAVVRVADDSVLSVVGDNYTVHQPSDLANFFADVAGAAGASVDTLGTLRGGRLLWAQAEIPGLTLDVGTHAHPDVSVSRLTVMTSHDGTLATQIGSAATRIVCRNTFAHALGENRDGAHWRKIRHTAKSAEMLRDVTSALQAMVTGWQAYADTAQGLVDKRVSSATARELIEALIPNPELVDGRQPSIAKAQAKRDAILWEMAAGAGSDLPSAQGTAWGLLNAVTAFATWGAPVKGGADSRWDSALLGSGADLSQQAFVMLSSL